MIDGLCHISTIAMELRIAHLIDFFHNFFVGKSLQTDHIAYILHKLINGDAARVLRVRNAKLCVQGVYGAFCKFYLGLDEKEAIGADYAQTG